MNTFSSAYNFGYFYWILIGWHKLAVSNFSYHQIYRPINIVIRKIYWFTKYIVYRVIDIFASIILPYSILTSVTFDRKV